MIFSPCQELGDDVENQQRHDVKAPPGCALLLLLSWFFSFFYGASVCSPYYRTAD